MGSNAVRVWQWLGFVSDLLSGEPLCDLPHELVFDQLSMTFAVDGLSYNWCGPGRPPGMMTRPSGILDPLGDLLGSWRRGELLQRHPLTCWYLTTGEIRPTTLERVPTSMVSARRREQIVRGLRQVGLEQQLSINFRLGSVGYDAYVLGRRRSDTSSTYIESLPSATDSTPCGSPEHGDLSEARLPALLVLVSPCGVPDQDHEMERRR